MSNNNPSDWIQMYQTGFSGTTQTETPPITTTSRNNNNPNSDPNPNPTRPSRPIRRRSRASRRTPTTLLNTDPSNFRAMVQQFTGGPTAQFGVGPQLPIGGPNFGFTQQMVVPSSYPITQQHVSYMNFNVHGGGGASSHAPPPQADSGDENRSFGNYML